MIISGISVQELAEKYGTPLYVYDFSRIRENAQRLKTAFHSDDVSVDFYYAMKANCHPAILDVFVEEGYGMDCVSPGELKLALLAGVKPENILYTGNYESKDDLKAAFDSGAKINLDDISTLYRLLKIGTPEMITYRINPGKGKGKYEEITTGGDKAKFGVPYEKAVTAYKNAIDAGIKRFGAHMMTGSGVLDAEYFPNMLDLFLNELGEISSELGINFEFIDMGGGLGIPYFGDDETLDIKKVGKNTLSVFRKKVMELKLGNPTLALEPGRYLVGDAGIMVSRVTGIKEGYRTFIGIDAGFNTLIRSALYGAQHPIVIDGKENEAPSVTADICGQICENTDIFAKDRMLPLTEEGDLAVFTQAGAYGNVMSMPYNLRFRPAEVAIVDGKDKLITRREVFDDYMSRIQTL
ncbi:MAG: diaminopimelate decarboxylase [Candidatus Marinimicrobia bacterium]|nr:diaminopimelate decarboxylase [Candidatus Neomarinimicrobiota bacterium]MBL7068071.1 diaminopimelate decarboxylase [Candidatus Neomarinimicrobiota bacterium]